MNTSLTSTVFKSLVFPPASRVSSKLLGPALQSSPQFILKPFYGHLYHPQWGGLTLYYFNTFFLEPLSPSSQSQLTIFNGLFFLPHTLDVLFCHCD